METKENQAMIKDLVQTTNDRISGFEKVEDTVWESYPDIKAEYDRMITQTKIMKNELIDILRENESDYEDDSSTVRGNLHSTWIDLKSVIGVSSVNSTLESVISGEEAGCKTYEQAVATQDLTEDTRRILDQHHYLLKQSHDQFKKILEYRQLDND